MFSKKSKLFNTNKKSENEDLIMKSSNAPKYITSYTPPNESVREQYLNDISSNLIKMHGSKPSLVLGFNPSILTHQKDTDGVSMQIKGLINDLNYQLNVTGFQDPKGIVLPFCDITDLDIGVLVQTLKHFAFDLTTIDLSYNRLGNAAVENLFYTMGTHQTPAKYVKNINLSNNFIGDYGAEYIAQSVKSGRYPNLKLLNIGSNQITPEGFQNMNNILGQVPQEILIVTENIEKLSDNGQAVFKSSKGDFYDMVIKSDGKETTLEFADGITGISAGDTCPAPVKDQLEACFLGGVTGGMKGWVSCGGSGKSKLVCIAKDALMGCSIATTGIGLKPCISLGNEYKDSDKGGFGFTVDGGTEIKGTYVDNDHGLTGSNFDLSQHDFN